MVVGSVTGLGDVGTSVPSRKRCSRKTAVAALVRAALPSPTRTTVKVGAQVPSGSHSQPPFSLQAVPAATGGCEGTPALHTSFVQLLLSTGTSVLSAVAT